VLRRDLPQGEPRFGMLGTIHEYALECLVHSTDDLEMRRRHAGYFLTLAERAEPELRRAQREQWLDHLELEQGNLRATLAWSTSVGGDRQLGLRLAGALGLFWRSRGYFSEGRQWLAKLLDNRAGLARTRELARVLESAGTLAWAQGEMALARALIEDSLAIGHELNDDRVIAQALNSLGTTLLNLGQPDRARTCFHESVEHFRAVHEAWGEADGLNQLGIAAMMVGDFQQARSRCEESLVIFRKLGDPRGISSVLAALGGLSATQGDTARAQTYLEEALALLRGVGARFDLAWVVVYFGFAVLFQGDIQRAQALFQESFALGKALGTPIFSILYLAGQAGIAALRSQTQPPDQKLADLLRVAHLWGASEHLYREHGVTLWFELPITSAQWLGASRAQVDAATWNAAFAEGQAMTLDQALAYVAADREAGEDVKPP